MDRLSPDHADFLISTFSNDGFWNAYRANQDRTVDKQTLVQQLQFEYEHLPGQVGKIEWLISRTCESDIQSAMPIGLASLSAFSASQSRAEFMLGLFDSEHIRTGIGLETSLLVFAYAFNLERLHKLVSIVYASNPKAQKNTLALGFSNEGLLKAHFRSSSHDSLIDAYQNGLLSRDFRSNTRLVSLSLRLLGYDITEVPADKSYHDQTQQSPSELRASFTIE